MGQVFGLLGAISTHASVQLGADWRDTRPPPIWRAPPTVEDFGAQGSLPAAPAARKDAPRDGRATKDPSKRARDEARRAATLTVDDINPFGRKVEDGKLIFSTRTRFPSWAREFVENYRS